MCECKCECVKDIWIRCRTHVDLKWFKSRRTQANSEEGQDGGQKATPHWSKSIWFHSLLWLISILMFLDGRCNEIFRTKCKFLSNILLQIYLDDKKQLQVQPRRSRQNNEPMGTYTDTGFFMPPSYSIRKITLCPGQLWVALRSFKGIRLGLKIW